MSLCSAEQLKTLGMWAISIFRYKFSQHFNFHMATAQENERKYNENMNILFSSFSVFTSHLHSNWKLVEQSDDMEKHLHEM